MIFMRWCRPKRVLVAACGWGGKEGVLVGHQFRWCVVLLDDGTPLRVPSSVVYDVPNAGGEFRRDSDVNSTSLLDSKLLYALGTINLIHYECSLFQPLNTFPARIQELIRDRALDSNAESEASQ